MSFLMHIPGSCLMGILRQDYPPSIYRTAYELDAVVEQGMLTRHFRGLSHIKLGLGCHHPVWCIYLPNRLGGASVSCPVDFRKWD